MILNILRHAEYCSKMHCDYLFSTANVPKGKLCPYTFLSNKIKFSVCSFLIFISISFVQFFPSSYFRHFNRNYSCQVNFFCTFEANVFVFKIQIMWMCFLKTPLTVCLRERNYLLGLIVKYTAERKVSNYYYFPYLCTIITILS